MAADKEVRLEMAVEQTDIRSMNMEELTKLLCGMGEKPYRAGQVFQWLHEKQVTDFEQMANIPKKLRERLAADCVLTVPEILQVRVSKLDGTKKYLFRLPDGNVIESVLMRYRHGNSVCISSQAGCRMGCRFCASAIGGLVRNLRPSEMLGQVYQIAADIRERITNVVVMGTGEPFDNFENLIRFIRLISDERGMNLSQRSITVSTCGIVPRIREFAGLRFSVTLALSLHASSQEQREQIMPVAARYRLPDVLSACDYFFEKTGRRVTFEYSLIHGVNDTDADAKRLCALLHGKNCHVNLIPVNPVKERDFVQPDARIVTSFKNKLEKNGINVTIRREMGRDIDGACGQLRKRYIEGYRQEERHG